MKETGEASHRLYRLLHSRNQQHPYRTTTSSVGTMPITIDRLIRKVGADEEVANFTAPLEQQSVWQDVHVYAIDSSCNVLP